MAGILVVDDEDGLRRVLARHWRGQGHEVTEVADFFAVRDRFDARAFDAVFLDIAMPIMNGGDVCAALRLAQNAKDFDLVEPPPIILMTAYPELVRKEIVEKVNGPILSCLVKPFDLAAADAALALCMSAGRAA